MRSTFFALTSITLIVNLLTSLLLPSSAHAEAKACPYLNQISNTQTRTKATYEPHSKTLNIQVAHSIPQMLWPIAESRTNDGVDKILANCPSVNVVKVKFDSGQIVLRKR
uniref:Uncharacterized protein n=1 Tax=Cyanothece sp. (strain PCC 7425 / ATCC 29141) TaxID=395961 RepID=B8HXP0_CYAP4